MKWRKLQNEMSSENMRKTYAKSDKTFLMMHMEISNEPKRGKKKYYDIRNTTKEVLGIGDLVVKERQVNLSQEGWSVRKEKR